MTDRIHRDLRLRSMPIQYQITDRPAADSLIVMMPTAASAARQAKKRPTFSRFTWTHLWPGSEILALADPALPLKEGVNGAWFVHPRVDVIKIVSHFISDMAAKRNIPLERVCLYGSSVGGFGAIAVASLLAGSTAVAEVPETDVRTWRDDSVAAIEREIIGDSIEDLYQKYPERITLIDRIRRSGHVPAVRLITNSGDPQLPGQRGLFEFVQNSDLPRTGCFELILTDEVYGHKPVSASTAQRMVAFQS